MVRYPISVPRDSYSRRDERRRRKAQRHNEIAKICEDYLNKQVQICPDETQQYNYGSIAIETNLSVDDVRDVLYGVDAGHNGITIRKSER